MGRGARPRVQQAYRGPLRYQTQEVRHMMFLHAQSLNVSTPEHMPSRGRTGRGAFGALAGLRGGSDLAATVNRLSPDSVEGAALPTAQANRVISELAAELQKYRQAIEQASDPLSRGTHIRRLTEILVEQEDRARQLFESGQAPPKHVIVAGATMRAAGMRTDELRPVCDRGLPWRVWESTAWNTQALRQNQEACARDMNRITTGMNVPQPWLVTNQGELIRLRAHMAANRSTAP